MKFHELMTLMNPSNEARIGHPAFHVSVSLCLFEATERHDNLGNCKLVGASKAMNNKDDLTDYFNQLMADD